MNHARGIAPFRFRRQNGVCSLIALGKILKFKQRRKMGSVGSPIVSISVDDRGYLVKPDVALTQHKADEASRAARSPAAPYTTPANTSAAHDPANPTPMAPSAPTPFGKHRYYSSIQLDKLRLFRDIETIEAEVNKHLTDLVNADVEIIICITLILLDSF